MFALRVLALGLEEGWGGAQVFAGPRYTCTPRCDGGGRGKVGGEGEIPTGKPIR